VRDYRVAGRALPPPGHSRASATHWAPRPWADLAGLPTEWRAALARVAQRARRSLGTEGDDRGAISHLSPITRGSS
jgi:hypothetical protein